MKLLTFLNYDLFLNINHFIYTQTCYNYMLNVFTRALRNRPCDLNLFKLAVYLRTLIIIKIFLFINRLNL